MRPIIESWGDAVDLWLGTNESVAALAALADEEVDCLEGTDGDQSIDVLVRDGPAFIARLAGTPLDTLVDAALAAVDGVAAEPGEDDPAQVDAPAAARAWLEALQVEAASGALGRFLDDGQLRLRLDYY